VLFANDSSDKVMKCYASLPRCWNIHKVVLVFKSGDSNCVKNYHSISLLFVVSKGLKDLYLIK